MGSPLIKRLDALYQRAQMVMKVQADHAPFVSIAPWSFIKDECIVKYYPEGHYQKPEQITTTLHDALMIAQYYYECGVYVQFTMSLCIEWLFLFVRDDPRYSPPQQKSWYTKNVEEYPEITAMLESEQRFEIIIVLLKTVLNAAVDDEILMKNPTASVKPLRKDDRPKASETIHRALTREEQQAFMQEAKTEWLYEFFCFSLCTGMRLNEITALKWQDIDYINNVIRVNKTVSWKEGGGIEETLPKSDTSNRDIPMNDTIKKILQMQKTKMSMVYGEIHARKMDSNIFIGSNGAKAIASSTVSSAIDNVLKRLRQQGIEIERFTHHAFRDTFATRYIEEGGNMQTLQKILGHSSLAMTADLYAHVLPNTKQQEMQQIENGFIGVAVL